MTASLLGVILGECTTIYSFMLFISSLFGNDVSCIASNSRFKFTGPLTRRTTVKTPDDLYEHDSCVRRTRSQLVQHAVRAVSFVQHVATPCRGCKTTNAEIEPYDTTGSSSSLKKCRVINPRIF